MKMPKAKKQETGEYLKTATEVKKYKGEPLKTWKWAKEMRVDYYRNYAEAHDKGGLCITGSAWAFLPIVAGLGDDAYFLSGEPYGASTAFDRDFSTRCMEAVESKGWAVDLCGYLRNYVGSVILNEYTFGGPMPKPDLILQNHICCSHAKWKQLVNEYEGGDVPFLAIDVSVGPYEVGPGKEPLEEHRLKYVVDQVLDAIEKLDKLAQEKWGRRFDDEKFIEAVNNDCNATSLWAEICWLNQAVPAPIDAKSMYPYFNLAAINRHRKEVTDIYKVLRDELKDRIARGVAAVPTERFRIMEDCAPPWYFLDIYRQWEEYGAACVGSHYIFGLVGIWEEDEHGNRIARKTPEQLGIKMRTREDAVRVMVDWLLTKPFWKQEYSIALKNDILIKLCRQWKADAAVLHYNRGCEMMSQSVPESRSALMEAGFHVFTYEADMADWRSFDEARIRARIDAFMEGLGLQKLKA